MHLSTANNSFMLFSAESMVGATLDPSRLKIYGLLGLLSADICTPEGIWDGGRDRKSHQYDKGLCGTPKTASGL